MPELPEVETVRRSFEVCLPGQRLISVKALRKDLRFPIPLRHLAQLSDQKLHHVRRRGKYLLLDFDQHIFLSHLGMSGHWRMADAIDERKHDHLILQFEKDRVIYNDPRRFGFVDVFKPDKEGSHPRLTHLGPEPLGPEFTAEHLSFKAKGRESNVKSFIMNAEVVVGVGNIYAVEALYRARIHPKRSVTRISQERWHKLALAIKEVLTEAIAAGGSTIRDFRQSSGESGYFQKSHDVYGRGGEPCRSCERPLKSQPIAGRATVWCPHCQK